MRNSSNFFKTHKLITVSLCLGFSFFLSTCGKKSGGGVNILCSVLSSSQDSSSMTVGLGKTFLDFLSSGSQNLTLDDASINEKLKTTVNSALESASLSKLLTISDVTSVPVAKGEDDGVRFLSVGGSLGKVSKLASSLLGDPKVKEALSSTLGLVAGEDPFSFIEDSFKVNAAVTTVAATAAEYNQSQWAYKQTDLTSALAKFTALPDQKDQVVVAVIDTGVDLDHPALENVLYKENGVVKGYNFVANNANADDDQGHGTHCAGIIAAQPTATDKMTGVAELAAPGKIKIMPIKVLGKDGGGSTSGINKGIRWAIAEGADVISMSLGGAVDFESLQKGTGSESQIIRDAVDKGVIVVVAAGNENCPLGGDCEQQSLVIFKDKVKKYTVLPCAYNGTVCVGASDPNGTLASYSNYPSAATSKGVDPQTTEKTQERVSPDISAPGTQIYSTYPGGGYKLLSGTSMATPYVAGLAALYKLKATEAVQKSQGSSQRSFWTLLQQAEIALKTEGDANRNFVGQVDLAYFSSLLTDAVKSTATATKPDVVEVESPETEDAPSGDAPNLMSLFCGG